MCRRPIIMDVFSTRAILDRRKWQTRRVIKPQPVYRDGLGWSWRRDQSNPPQFAKWKNKQRFAKALIDYCPYGQPGDQLWVRETWRVHKHYDNVKPSDMIAPLIWYTASPAPAVGERYAWGKVRPSIFLPRWASRLTLKITDIGVERVREITHEDALAEGVADESRRGDLINGSYAITRFADLWDSINAKRGFPWDSNPWVWVICFKVLTVGAYNHE